MNSLDIFLSDLKPNVISLTEHWLRISQVLSVNMSDYEMASCYSRSLKIHGGSCILLKKGVPYTELVCLKQKSKELIFECSSVELSMQNIIIINLYRSPSGDIQQFFDILEDTLEYVTARKNTYDVVLTGDFNINFLDTTNIISRRLLDLLQSYNLHQTIFEPTRITNNSSTCRDNIFTTLVYYESCVIHSALSDHLAQSLSFQSKIYRNEVFHEKRLFTENNLFELKEILANIQWQDMYKYELFNELLQSLINTTCPLKIYRNKSDNTTKGWITPELQQKCRQKRILYEDALNNKIDYHVYQNYAKTLQTEIRDARKCFYSAFIATSTNKTRATWQVVKGCTNKNSQNSFCVGDLQSNLQNDEAKLAYINNFLIKICEAADNDNKLHTQLLTQIDKTVYLFPTTPNEIFNIINSLKNTCAVGHDGISVKLLKYCASQLAEPISFLVNYTLETGNFPDMLKWSTVTLIHKKGSKSDIGNYRPISILSNISKIYEKVVYRRIYKFVEKHNILHTMQNGFVQGRSTARAVYQAMMDIYDGINDHGYAVGIFMDLSKAFDSVNYEKLYKKLQLMGIRGTSLKLIESYLTGRKQRISSLDGENNIIYSDWQDIERGIPQGSILGPLLFLLYVNELPTLVKHNTVLYADDTSVIIKNNENLHSDIQLTLSSFEEWFNTNSMSLNMQKTSIVLFSHYKQKLEITYNNTILTGMEQTTFLGLKVDSQLNWKSHVSYLASKISSFNYALRIVSQYVDVHASLSAYYAYVHSRLRYGIIFWGNSVEASRIFVLQKSCIRSIFHLKRNASCRDTFKNFSILTLPGIYIYECACFAKENYELLKNQEIDHSYNTRGRKNCQLVLPQTTKTMVSKSITSQMIRVYNHLPLSIRNLTLKLFKRQLNHLLSESVVYTVSDFYNLKF